MASEKILIVEDEKIIALDLQRRLQKFGYTVCGMASEGQEAIEKAEQTQPDMILMDIMLKGNINGIAAAEEIKEKFHIPIIFLTAYADETTLNRAKQVAPLGYILKPFKERELYTTIDMALYKHKLDQQLHKQERWFSALLNSIGDGIIAIDEEEKIIFMNPVAESMTGWFIDETSGYTLKDIFLLHAEKTGKSINLMENTSFESAVFTNRNKEHIYVAGSSSRILDKQGFGEGRVIAFRDLSPLKEITARLNYQASHDSLTGLVNRKQFSEKLQFLFEDSQQNRKTHGLLYIDLDQFKIVNDTSGHLAGDELLQQVTRIIQQNMGDSESCARLGGDEFGILFEDIEEAPFLKEVETIKKSINLNDFSWQHRNYPLKVSMGVVLIDSSFANIHAVMAAADDACFMAKEEGGDKIKVYRPDDNKFLRRRGEMKWISRLSKSLEEDNFVLYYQPISHNLNQGSRKADKYEVLIRLKDEDGSIITPNHFIPAAERYNLMTAIDRWVIDMAMKDFKRIQDNQKNQKEKLKKIFSINLSGHSLLEENLPSYIQDRLAFYQLEASSFCFEITETAAIANLQMATQFIHTMKSLGFTFALDDFGSGFSSFAYLKNLPVDYLKIDGMFVRDMLTDPINYAMVESINHIGHVMGKKTIAEFVGDKDIRENLNKIGVDFSQGFYIARPAPLSQLV